MPRKADHTGETLGSFYLARKAKEKGSGGATLYKGVCIFCGAEVVRTYPEFVQMKGRNYCCCDTRFNRYKWKEPRLRSIFEGMKNRCNRPSFKAYKLYGGRGIKICDEWAEDPGRFEQWAFENGYVVGLTIDRIDSDKGYCPENCRWVEKAENSRNTSRTIVVEVDGIALSLRQWSDILEITSNAIYVYYRRHGEDGTKDRIRNYLADHPIDQPNS